MKHFLQLNASPFLLAADTSDLSDKNREKNRQSEENRRIKTG